MRVSRHSWRHRHTHLTRTEPEITCLVSQLHPQGWALKSEDFTRDHFLLAHVGAASRPFRSVERTCVPTPSKLKTRSKNIDVHVVTSNGRVTDTTSAETNLASHLTPAAPGAWSRCRITRCRSFSLLLPVPRARVDPYVCPLSEAVVQDHGAVRTEAPLVSQRLKPSQVIGRILRAASALSATTECLPARCRDDVSGAVREEVRVCLSMVRS
jgi:hypothetical protein